MRLSDAINVKLKSSDNGVEIYKGQMDQEWCIRSVPNGGYVLGQIVQACILYQEQRSLHPDPIHVTGHFLYATSVSPFEVHIRVLKLGKNFTNLAAELLQDNISKVTSHLIFGVLEPPSNGGDSVINLIPPSPYARRVPLYEHPSKAPRAVFPSHYKFYSRLDITREPEIAVRNLADSSHRTTSDTIGGGGLDYGLWCGFRDKGETVTVSSIPFLADISSNVPLLLPKEYRKGLGKSWFPTLVMTIEYKYSMTKTMKAHSDRTVGIFSSTNFLQGELGRHDMYTEVWTAPCDVGENVEATEGWRDNQICLAVSTQMALTVSVEKNFARGKL
ncbi:hypothetical protein GYMLUDRAFT_34172 [Collybiopsis luxurians FD-317 M1]|nr:hypothetical protein GYMLUDRAFT_34172 [Collybiopsis luxurians FD-317 M1]